jgi:acyl carrier protein
MLQRTPFLEQTVLAAMSAASVDKAVSITLDTTVLEVVDSLGLFIALTDIQDGMGLTLEPAEILRLFRCRSIADIIQTLASS